MPHPITLLALGDSLTEGYGLDPDDALPAALERLLRAGGHDVTVINLGLSGDTTAGGLRRLRAWLVRNPGFGNDEGAAPHCFAMVELGANDGFMGLDPQDMEENLAAILALLAERRVPALLAGFKAEFADDPDYAEEYDALFPRLSARFGVPLWPYVLEGVWGLADLTLWDGLHPNVAGVEQMARAALPYVLGLLGNGGAPDA
ncbi:arylesterase [Nitratidesulfovibrio sp. HK-II]|uniref:GDSL-type esterase/lipase family protein n=1 Tax=Nitratidesulfovibrio sp. HK-II TaxID=2009266 RepID=UPI000E2F2772|nr:GDSL-type esterase/lipase family protein [Nitratidesulfovibrio sp. HK-II]GBO96043.1 arylesterase precursor [Nitratidesulfovibrio sp. HK-II]